MSPNKRSAQRAERRRAERGQRKRKPQKTPTPPPSPTDRWSISSQYSNAGGLQQAGPIIQVTCEVAQQHAKYLESNGLVVPPPVTGLALIDTGATQTNISEAVANTLQLKPIGYAKGYGAGGLHSRPAYLAMLSFIGTNVDDDGLKMAVYRNGHVSGITDLHVPFERMGVQQDGIKEVVALIGRDLLSGMKLTYEGQHGRFSLEWSLNSMRFHDQGTVKEPVSVK